MKKKSGRELALFKLIWEEREHISFLSGKKLQYFDVKQMAHVVAKSRGEQYRLRKDNIVLLTYEEHMLYDAGTEKQREDYAKKWNCDWKKLYKLKEKIMREKRTVHTDVLTEEQFQRDLEEKGFVNINVTTYKSEIGDEIFNKVDIVIWSDDFRNDIHNETFDSVEEAKTWITKL